MSVPVGGLVTDPAGFFQRVETALGERYRPEMIVAASRERVLFRAEDLLLKRRVSLRVNFFSDHDVLLNLDEGADARPCADRAAIQIHEISMVDDAAVTQLDI